MICDVCEDVEWIVATGPAHYEQVCSRLGVTPVALRRHLVRHGRADLSALLPGLAAATNGRAVARR